jgi:hypothetical protein
MECALNYTADHRLLATMHGSRLHPWEPAPLSRCCPSAP